jgi:hypothetical protein
LAAKATSLKVRYDAVLTRLPKALAERLELPDWSVSSYEDTQDDPFERLAEQAREG